MVGGTSIGEPAADIAVLWHRFSFRDRQIDSRLVAIAKWDFPGDARSVRSSAGLGGAAFGSTGVILLSARRGTTKCGESYRADTVAEASR